MSSRVGASSTVTFHLEGVDEHGAVVDSTFDAGKPLTVVMGTGALMKGLESALFGMEAGEQNSVVVRPEDGYGQRDETLVRDVEPARLPKGYSRPAAGDVLQIELDGGQQRPVTVLGVERGRVLIDFNHPLCGRTITYAVTIVSVD